MKINLDGQWMRVCARLRGEFGETAYKNWFSALELQEEKDGIIYLSVPTSSSRDWIENQYLDRILTLWRGENAKISDVKILLNEKAQISSFPHPTKKQHDSMTSTPSVAKDKHIVGVTGSSATDKEAACFDARLSFDRFVVGKSNEMAFAVAKRVADENEISFNPLVLYGGVGLGKTHLMQAIALEIQKKHPEKKVLYLSAEKFMYHFIRALRYKDTISFKEQFRSVDVLMVDDIQFIADKDNTQEEFFHTFNSLVDDKRRVVISADKSPAELDGIEARMKSRMGSGLVIEIKPTNYELRLGILQSKLEREHIDVPLPVLEFLANKITSNVRELEGALNRLIAYADLVGRSITIETVKDVLQDLLRANNHYVTIEEIQKTVAEHFHIKIHEMHSTRRARMIARPRQVAMYLSKQLTTRSLPEIGRSFGGRDHTTVMHAVRKVTELCDKDPAFAKNVSVLTDMLKN